MRYRSVAGWPRVAAVALLLCGAASSAGAAEQTESGQQLYLRYCGACHGPQGKGDGVVGKLMQPSPPDLTRLAARNGGEFPLEPVVRSIDGRQAPRAHGEPVMPVWGQVLSEELGSGDRQRVPIERRVQGRIFSIADYLRTIQEK